MQKNKTGFTLIELLVVVLIIGILAAVALPQYQVAVAKSRLAATIPTVSAFKQAAESYYLANGKLEDDISKYDVDFPNCKTNTAKWCETNKNIIFDISTNIGFCSPSGSRRDDVAVMLMQKDGKNALLTYGLCLDISDKPHTIFCAAAQNSPLANNVCKSMGGILSSEKECLDMFAQNKCNIYTLP